MAKRENLPQMMEPETGSTSAITYANDVVATIAGVAASEVDGITGMCSANSGSILNRNKNVTKGVKVEVGTEEVSCELYVVVEYDRPIQKVAQDVQENVRKAIESMTGLHVVRVDVHVQGINFAKDNAEMLPAGEEKIRIEGETAPVAAAPVAEPVAEEASAEEAPAEEQ